MKPFPCSECGGTMRMSPPVGVDRDYGGGITFPLPFWHLIPQCDRCGETYVSSDDTKWLDGYVEGAAVAFGIVGMFEAIRRRYGA